MCIRVWDNGGSTADRYTVAIRRVDSDGVSWDVYTMSSNPLWPQGVNLYSFTAMPPEVDTFDRYGERVMVHSLPYEIQSAILQRAME